MTYDTAKSIRLYPRLAIEFKYKTYILEGKTGFCYFFLKEKMESRGCHTPEVPVQERGTNLYPEAVLRTTAKSPHAEADPTINVSSPVHKANKQTLKVSGLKLAEE